MLMMMLVRTPGSAAGRMTVAIARHLLAPRLIAASLYVAGTALSASSEARITVGSTRRASVSEPARTLFDGDT